ncbi:MAG: tRNA pseudouridine(38-40) synthase TruA [Eubacteriales bacterium]|nr:tRNA pseudouridine(38-40) synthase TruA [Eubacteriales bacterium]
MNYRMLIQYDGTKYNGWQRQQSTDNTIQGKIEAVLSRIAGMPVEIYGAGRTDAGVHALGQVANVSLDLPLTATKLRDELNRWLPEDIGILEVTEAAPRFHSRLNAIGKVYCYRIATRPELHVFDRRQLYPFTAPLDVAAMRRAADCFVGEHDFQGFCTRKTKKSTVRRIDRIQIEEMTGELCITYQGSGFLYNMIRILTGTLIEVGTGQRSADSMKALLTSKKRADAGFTAPARGLTLLKVLY